MHCQFCKEVVEDVNALQLHQVTSCPAMNQVTVFENETIDATFKWLVDRVTKVPSVFLICSDMEDNIELKKCVGCFKSSKVKIKTGKYSGQLVLGHDIYPLKDFEISLLNEVVHLIVNSDTSIDSKADLVRDSSATTTDDTASTVRRQSPHLTRDANNMEALSPLHQEMLDHQIKNDYDFGDTQVENKLYGGMLPEECIKSEDAVMINTLSDLSTSTQIKDPSPDLPRINQLPRDREADDSFYQSFASPSVFETLDADDSPPSTPRSKRSPPFGNIRNLLNELSVEDDDDDDDDDDEKVDPAMQSCLGEEFLSHELEDAMQDTTAPLFQSTTSFSTVNTSTPKPRPKPIIHESIRAQNVTLDYAGNPMVYDEAMSINIPYQEDYNPDATSSLDNDRGSVGHIESRLTKSKNQEVVEAEEKEKEKMYKDLQRMKELLENYKEVKLDLETKCESYDNEVERLKLKCVELEQNNADQSDMKDVIAAKDTMIGELNVKADSYESEMNRLNLEVIRLSKTLDDGKARSHQEKNDLHAAHQLEIRRYNEKLKHLSEELEDLQKLVEGYRDERVEVDAKCESFKTEVARQANKCSDLEKLVGELQKSNGELQDSLLKKEESASAEKDKDTRIVELNQKSASAEMEIVSLNKELLTSNELVEELKMEKLNLETKCGKFEIELNQLNQKCQDLAKHHGEVSKDTSKDASKLKAYKTEITRLDGELLKINSTVTGYKEQKSLLESKCVAYESEIKDLHEKCANLEKASSNDAHNVINDTVLVKNRIIGDMKVKTESYESELNRLQQEVNNLLELNEEYKNIKHVLESKCESFQKEIESLKENHPNYEQHQKVNDIVKACQELDKKCKELQLANQKLLEDYSGLEGAKHVYEEEVLAERDRYEKQIRELTEEKIRLLSMTKPDGGKYSDNHARMNINRLKSENKILKEKLNLIRNESELCDSTTSKENISPAHLNGYKPPLVPTSKSLDPDIMNTSSSSSHHSRPSKSHRHKQTISNEDYTLPSRYNANRYSASPDASYDKTDFVPRHVVDNNSNHSYNKKNHLDDVMRRYSSPVHMEHHATAPPPAAEVNHVSRSRVPSSSFQDTSLSFLDCNSYLGSSKYSSRSRSMDHLDTSGTEDATFYSAKSLVTIPFCPTSIKELTVGMKISVNRANGRLSRGTVRWIGTLPRQTGDYVGVELTSEVGKHDGTLHGVQYFKCQKNSGIFVKFKKVIMAWR